MKKCEIFNIKSVSFDRENNQGLIELLVLLSIFSCFIYSNLARAVVGITALIFLFRSDIRIKIFQYKSIYILLAFVWVSFIVALLNLNFFGALASLSFMAMMFVAYVTRSIVTKRFYEQIFDTIILGGCMATFGSIIEKLININVPGYRCQVFFPNPNFFGLSIAIVIMVCAYKAATVTKKVYIYYLAAIFNACGLLLCGSYSLFPTAALCIALFLFFARKYKLLAIFLGLGVLAVAVMLLFPQFLSRLNEMGATTDNRIKIWRFAFEHIKEQPLFGHGFAGYLHLFNIFHYSQDVYQATFCHNLIVDILLCHGIIGMCIIISFVTCYIKSLIRCCSKKLVKDENLTINKFIIAMLIALLCYAMIDTTYIWIQTGMLILLICAGVGLSEKEFKND